MRVFVLAVILSLPIVYSSCGDGGGGGTGPDPVPAEILASFELTVPDSIAEGVAFSLAVTAVGNRGTKPLTSYSGSVVLSTTLGTVTPASVAVASGTGSAQVTLSHPGQQTLAATGGGKTGSANVDVTDVPDPTIPGNPTATLEQAVPDSVFNPDPNDYSDDHPRYPGIFLSKTTILVAFEIGTTVQTANDLLKPLGGVFVGGVRGVSDQVPSIMMVELASSSHQEMEAALTAIRADPTILSAVQDALMEVKAIPGDNKAQTDWTWDKPPNGGNWGLELLRVPQMWNLNRALEKAEALVWTGILDRGFVDGHEDLGHRFPVINLSPGVTDTHGNMMAGIIGADFNNETGIDGINPFTGLIVKSADWSVATGPAAAGSFGQAITNLAFMLYSYPEIRVLNISMGFRCPGDANTDFVWQQWINDCGKLVATMLQTVGSAQTLPLISVAAGNESNLAFGLQQAKFQNAFCNASIEHGMEPILCIENVAFDVSDSGNATRWITSNIGGHLSAPGTSILSTAAAPNSYDSETGTSEAAPHVAGLVGYMLAVDPTLTIPQIRAALIDTSVPVGGFASNRIDAWAAVMEIDRVQGDDRVLKMMLDIDDGTEDGNLRVNYEEDPGSDKYHFEDDDFDQDGGIGDGIIDMSDFRTWRDWYLKTISRLDDERQKDHLKLDVNDNGEVEDGAGESTYPRGDFNGDGILSREDSVWVLGAVQDSLADLDVLKVLFDDPDYLASDLDTLVISDDFNLNPNTLFYNTGAASLLVEVRSAETGHLVDSRVVLPLDSLEILTYPSEGLGHHFKVTVGSTVFTFGDHRFLSGAGWDHYLRPITSVTVPVRGAFLKVCDQDTPSDPVVIDLAAIKVKPGDRILLNSVGDASQSVQGQEEPQAVFGVFSASDELLDRTNRYRVPGAIQAEATFVSGETCTGGETDIPQDFKVPPSGGVIDVPQGATHLFLANHSEVYSDNRDADGDLGLQITVIRKDFPKSFWSLSPSGSVSQGSRSREEEGLRYQPLDLR